MKPSAAQYRQILTNILAQIDQSDPTYTERQLMISCVLTMADAVEKMERYMGRVVGPALLKLATPVEEAAAPETVAEEETGDETPLATATIANATPATTPSGATPSAPATAGAHLKSGGSLVTTSAPTPIAKAAQP